MKLTPYAKKVHRQLTQRPLKATDVLYQKMHIYNNEAKLCLAEIINMIQTQNKNSPALKELFLLMRKCDDIVIDCAHKLAPYQTPKLETIEVRNKIEHRFVLRAPTPVKNVQDWISQTGAEKLSIQEKLEKEVKEEVQMEPSLHDFDEEEDQINTAKHLH